MQQHKKLLIAVVIITITAGLIFIFRKKLFTRNAAIPNGTDNINLEPNMQPVATVPAAELYQNLKVGDKAYSVANQEITRVEIENGHYVNNGSGTIGKDTFIGIVVKLTPNGYYIQSKKGLKSPFYYAGKSQVK